MKNLKKVLAMVLAFACTFTMFAGAKVFEDVPAGSDYSEAITMLSDLGIIQGKDDGKYHPEDTITRAEACAMIARMMTGDPNVSQYVGAQNFTDVAKGSWKDSAIGYCYINNIVIGVGNNKFEPDRAITDAEFITMVVRAMGYETADMAQGYPYTYMSNAQAIGLLDGVNMVANTDALRGEDAQVIYNALFADYARGAKLVNTTHGTSVETYPTLAESVWGLERAAVGTWDKDDKDDETAELTNCKAHTWVVIGADTSDSGRILAYPVDDDTTDLYTEGKGGAYSFKYDGDIEAIKGYQVELWGQGSHGEPTWENKNDKYVWSEDWEIKAIKTVKGQSEYDYNPSMADSKSDNGTIELDDNSLDLESVADNAKKVDGIYAVDQYVAKQYNGEKLNGKDDDKKVEAALNVRDGAQYKLMDWDSDGDVDWVVVSSANYYKVEKANSKRVTVVAMKDEGDYETQDKSDSWTWKLDDITEIGGVKYNFKAEDLEEGDIVEVTYTVAYDKGEKDEVVTANVSVVDPEAKSLDKVSTKGGLTLTFDDEEIAVAENNLQADTIVPANPAIYRDFNSEELGTDFNLYLNRNGFIVYSDYATETANYAMVLDVENGSDRAGNRDLAVVDLLLADNSVAKDVELTSGARVQDADGDDSDVYDNRKFDDDRDVVGNVYKYWTNEDGQITRMQAMFSVDDINENNAEYSYKSSTDRLTRIENGKSTYVASLEEADVIFAVRSTDGSYIKNDYDGNGFYVDADDVLAVKSDDIPDINLDSKDPKEDTENAVLDAEENSLWLHEDDGDDSTLKNTFVISADRNKAGTAALLGVDSFNKFNAGNTKIGLVTNVSYTNSSDGRYIEVDVATNGEVKTLESKKKVDFDDIVEVQGDGDVKSESTKVQNGVFHDGKGNAIALDKYLEDNAAYAEITTDADGNVTKVSFLDTESGKAEDNLLKGDYYTVSRNVVTENKSKSFDYVTSAAYYAADDELYSVDRMPINNAGIDDDAVYYTIDGRPTRADENYKNTQMVISSGFEATPDIEVSDKASMMTASIDNRYDSDTYYVADIAFNADGDIVAMYNYTDDMGETEAKDTVLASLDATKMQAGKGKLTMTVETVNGQAAQAYTLSDVYKADDSKKAKVEGFTVTNDNGDMTATDTNTIVADRTVAADKYAIDVLVNKDVVATLTFEVTAADTQTVGSVEKGDVASTGKAVNVTVKDTNGDAVEGLTAADFTVELNGQVLQNTADKNTYTVYHRGNGVYQIALQNMGDTTLEGKTLKVTVGGISVNFDSQLGSTDVTVDTTEEFENALADKNVKKITLTDDVAVPAGLEIANEDVVIDGNGQTITVDDKTRGKEAQFLISAKGVTLKNVTVVSNSDFAIQVYKATGVTLEDVTAVGAKGAVLVNGSEVTMKNCEVQNTGDSAWGGINVDKGKNVETAAELTIEGTLTFDKVAAGKPVIWAENTGNGVVNGFEAVGLTKQENKGDSSDQTWYVAE